MPGQGDLDRNWLFAGVDRLQSKQTQITLNGSNHAVQVCIVYSFDLLLYIT